MLGHLFYYQIMNNLIPSSNFLQADDVFCFVLLFFVACFRGKFTLSNLLGRGFSAFLRIAPYLAFFGGFCDSASKGSCALATPYHLRKTEVNSTITGCKNTNFSESELSETMLPGM